MENLPLVVVLVGGILAVLGSVLVSSQQNRQQARYEADVRQRADQLLKQTTEIADLNRQLARQTEEFNRTTLNWVTGGDSYAYFEPRKEPGRVAFFIRHGGGYPAYDVTIRVYYEKALKELKWIGTLNGGSGFDWTTMDSLSFPRQPASGDPARTIRVEISARNGIYVQTIRLEPSNGQWRSSSRLFEQAGVGPKEMPGFKELQEQ